MLDKKFFTIKTSINKKDYNRFLYIATFLRRKLTIPIIIIITALMSLFVAYSNKSFSLKNFFIYWFFLIVITLFAIIIKIEFKTKEKAKNENDSTLKSVETLELFDDYMSIKSTAFKGKSKIKYKKIYEILESKKYIIIYFNKRQASIIRKKDLEKGSLEDLRSFLIEKLGNKYKKLFK